MGDSINGVALILSIVSMAVSCVAISISIGMSKWFDTMMKNIHNEIGKVGRWKL